MKSNHCRFILILVIATLFCCKSTKLAPKIVIENIHFGSGGGFTGRVTTYSLFPDGQLSLIEDGQNIPIRKVDSITTENLFEKARAVRNYQYYLPGNMYAFLEIKEKEKEKPQRIVWEMNSSKVDSLVSQLYKELYSLATNK